MTQTPHCPLQTDRQTYIHTDTQSIEKPRHKLHTVLYRQTYIQTHRQTDIETETERDATLRNESNLSTQTYM